jgi:HAE1 family hydrophobic/amphiphilic exporter-1
MKAQMVLVLFTAVSCLATDRAGITDSRTLALDDAVAMALKNNLDVRIERANVSSAQQAAAGARGIYDPTFHWTPQFQVVNTPSPSILSGENGKLSEHDLTQNAGVHQRGWQGSMLDLSFDSGRVSTNTPFMGLNPYYTSQVRLALTQPLLRGRTIDSERALLKIRGVQTGIAKTELELRGIDVVSRVEQAYWDLAAARDSAEVNREATDLARTQLEQNRRMIAVGSLAAVELSASEAELERRLDNWYASLDLITAAENNLKTLIAPSREDGIWSQELVPCAETVETPASAGSLESAIAGALKTRPELRENGQQMDVNGIEQQRSADEIKPALNLVASYSNSAMTGTSGTPNPVAAAIGSVPVLVQGDRYHSFQAGLNFEWTARNRQARANLEQAAIGAQKLKLQRAQLEQTIEAQVRNAIQSLNTTRQRITAAQAASRAAKEKLESEQRLFANAESTNFLVLTRQNEYSDARQRLLAARLDFNKAVARFEEAVGTTLSSKNLAVE